MEVVRQSHTVPKIGTVCNDFHFACCVNHTQLTLANRCLWNYLWDWKPSPPNSKKEKENPHHPHVTKTLTPDATPSAPPVRSPFTPAQAPPRLCHGTAYRGGKHLARRLRRRQAIGKAHRISPLPLTAAYRHRLSRRGSRSTQLRSVGESAVLRVLSHGRQGN